jgi:transposase-like protein
MYMSPLPRVARVPHTAKVPDACPYCGSHNLVRRGTRKKKLEVVQLWRCSSCKRVFTPGPAALHNKTYPLRMILSALTDYNLGYTLEQTAARLKKKTGRHVSSSTITSWLREYHPHCTYRRLRADGLKWFPAEQTIRSIKLHHRQVYSYAYHRPKLDFLRAGSLDDKRAGDTHFAPLADFLRVGPGELHHRRRAARRRRRHGRPSVITQGHSDTDRVATPSAPLRLHDRSERKGGLNVPPSDFAVHADAEEPRKLARHG